MTKGQDIERQYRQAVRGVFETELGKWLLLEMCKSSHRAYVKGDTHETAYRLGQQEFVSTLVEIVDGLE